MSQHHAVAKKASVIQGCTNKREACRTHEIIFLLYLELAGHSWRSVWCGAPTAQPSGTPEEVLHDSNQNDQRKGNRLNKAGWWT